MNQNGTDMSQSLGNGDPQDEEKLVEWMPSRLLRDPDREKRVEAEKRHIRVDMAIWKWWNS